MKESGFIKQNIDKWNEYESELKKSEKDPAKISRLFVQITDDLSYAQTYYNSRSVRVYLNGVAQLLFNDLNRTSRLKLKSISDFWKVNLPITLYKIRYELLFSFLIFMVMIGVGVFTSIHQPEFARTILGNDYVSMTLENIQKNDPMAVYKKQNGFDMFLGITINNLVVAFRTFIYGLLFGLGTFLSLMHNGIMLGTFQYFFIERDLFRESFLTIWQHGTLEISSIVIAGAAGFTIGRGLILPASYTRFQSLRISARRGLKVMIGLTPVFILAAFIESFFTRYTHAPDLLRLISILLSLFFVLFYFVFYPRWVAKKYPEKLEIADKVNPGDNSLPALDDILPGDRLFGSTLKILKVFSSKVGRVILFSSLVFSILTAVFAQRILNIGDEGILNQSSRFGPFINYSQNPLMLAINTLAIALVLITGLSIMNKAVKGINCESVFKHQNWFALLTNSLLTSLLFNCFFLLPWYWAFLVTILFLPYLLIAQYTSFVKKKSLPAGIGQSLSLLKENQGMFILHNLKFYAICIVMLILANPGIYAKLLVFIRWNLWVEDKYVTIILNFLVSYVFYFVSLLCITLVTIANNLIYHSLWEIHSGEKLLKSVEQIGTQKIIRGYEFE